MPDESVLPSPESQTPAIQSDTVSTAESARLRELELIAQAEAEQNGGQRVPTELIFLLLAPLLLLVLPLVLFLALRGRPAAPPTAPAVASATFAPIQSSAIAWQTSFEAAQQLALSSNKPMMVDFYADWCGPCRDMDAQTFPDPSIVQEAQNVVPVKINVDNVPDLAQRYSITGLPTLVWINGDGTERGRITGGLSADQLLPIMQQYR